MYKRTYQGRFRVWVRCGKPVGNGEGPRLSIRFSMPYPCPKRVINKSIRPFVYTAGAIDIITIYGSMDFKIECYLSKLLKCFVFCNAVISIISRIPPSRLCSCSQEDPEDLQELFNWKFFRDFIGPRLQKGTKKQGLTPLLLR